MRTGRPIVYTSADSVFQIAAHEDIIPIPELYRICEIAYEMIGKGMTTRLIAGELHLSVKTVETHRENIKAKLNLPNSAELSREAVQWVMGRPDFSGGSQATARIRVTCSGVNLPGAPGRGSSLRTASMARRKSARDSQHSMSMS